MTDTKPTPREAQLIGAAQRVLQRAGVTGTTLRAVALEADLPLGSMHYVYPSKDLLLRAVITDIVNEASALMHASLEAEGGLERAIRDSIEALWGGFIQGQAGLQIMQYELVLYSLRSKDSADLARWQYERYCAIATEWCERAAGLADERCAISYEALARVLVASLDGLILQYLVDPDDDRARRDRTNTSDMLVMLADPQPVPRRRARRNA